jgi:hypothetical protein
MLCFQYFIYTLTILLIDFNILLFFTIDSIVFINAFNVSLEVH